jgi:DNA-binding MarR family transcriptional regulator
MAATADRASSNHELASGLVDGLLGMYRQLKSIRLPDGMTPERFIALAAIAERGPVSITRLASLVRVRAPAASRMVRSLTDDGLVVRREHATDGRGIVVALSPKGKRVLKKTKQQSAALISRALVQLSENQVTALAALVGALESINNVSHRYRA